MLKKIIEIAGRNAVAGNDEEKRRLCAALIFTAKACYANIEANPVAENEIEERQQFETKLSQILCGKQ